MRQILFAVAKVPPSLILPEDISVLIAIRRSAKRVVEQMAVAMRGLRLRVPKKGADDRQRVTPRRLGSMHRYA